MVRLESVGYKGISEDIFFCILRFFSVLVVMVGVGVCV